MCGSLDLIGIVIQTSNMGTSEMGDFTSGTTDTTTNIQNTHVTLDTNVGSQIMFMTSNSTVELFTNVVTAEMETATPTYYKMLTTLDAHYRVHFFLLPYS